MIEDLSDYPTPATIDTDVAIEGAGAAGITLARCLAKAKIRVCLLESGGRDYEQPVQDLAKGESVGFPYYPLAESRLRFFGGTTAIWGGRSAELDPIDFERRDWLSDSGWPFGKDVPAPYYESASSLLDLPLIEKQNGKSGQSNGHRLDFERSLIETSCWSFDERFERFTIGSCADLDGSQFVQVLLHATVVHIIRNASGTAVQALKVINLKGSHGTVRARAFVLAAGGLETPRLLLASHEQHEQAIGNEHDLVGRFFSEHPRARAGQVITDRPETLLQAMPRLRRSGGRLQSSLFRGSDELQRREGLLNTAFTLAVRKPPDAKMDLSQHLYAGIKHRLPPGRFGRWLWRHYRRSKVLKRERHSLARDWERLKGGQHGLYAIIRGEQAPNPASRIVLDVERDALGLPRIKLDWRFSEIENIPCAS